MSENEVLIEFKTQLVCFFDELISQFPQEGDLVVLRLFVTNQMPINTIMNIFVQKLNTNDQEFRKMAKERNESFFLENNIFDNFCSKEKIVRFKKLWLSGFDTEDKKVIWNWVDAFIYLADKYTKSIMNK
jgi:hypothetical protein